MRPDTVKVKETRESTQTIQRSLCESDLSIPFRFVGSYEYANALDNFNELVRICSADEVRVCDKMLNDRHEFTCFQGVNTAFREPPVLTRANPAERHRFHGRFQKGGLAWMMAPARIELGATLSMYGDQEFPCEFVANNSFGHEEYVELILVDIAWHLKSLAGEQMFRKVLRLRHRVDTWSIAYLRRLKLVKGMLVTISRTAVTRTIEQARPWFDELAGHEQQLVGNVAAWLETVTLTSKSESESSREIEVTEKKSRAPTLKAGLKN